MSEEFKHHKRFSIGFAEVCGMMAQILHEYYFSNLIVVCHIEKGDKGSIRFSFKPHKKNKKTTKE